MRKLPRRYETAAVTVTGGNGYLSSALRQALKNSSAEVLVVSRRELEPQAGETALVADVRVPAAWRAIVGRSDIIFHLAGNTSVYAAAEDPAGSLSSTVLPITHLVAAARETKRRPRVLFASTVTVYGLTSVLPVDENATLNPITTYDLHKLFAERELEMATRQGVLEGVSLRLANVYGPSRGISSARDRGVLNKVALAALKGMDVRLFGDGRYLRDYVYIDDVVQAFLKAGVRHGIAGQSFNLASGTGITIRDAFRFVIDRVEQVSGRRSRLQSVPWPDGADPIEFRSFAANVTALSTACRWRPSVSFNTGVSRLVDSLLGEDVVDA